MLRTEQVHQPPRTISIGGMEHPILVGDEAKALKSGGPTRRFMPPSKFGALAGADRYSGEHDVYALVARDIDQPAGEAAEWGRAVEPLIGEKWVTRFDRGNFDRWRRGQARTVGAWMKLYPDWEETPAPEILLEAKTVSAWRAHDWDDGVPLYYQCQVQPYMAVTGASACHVAVLVGGNELRAFILQRDDVFAQAILETAWSFWTKHVLPLQPPPIDGSKRARALIAELFPRVKKITRPALPHEVELMEELREIKRKLAALEKRKDEVENFLLASMGADYGITAPGIGKVLGVDYEAKPATKWSEVVKEARSLIGLNQAELIQLIEKHTTLSEARRDLRCYFEKDDTAE